MKFTNRRPIAITLRQPLAACRDALSLLVDFARAIPEAWKYRPETLNQIDAFIATSLPLGLYIGFCSGVASAIESNRQPWPLIPKDMIVNFIFNYGIIRIFPFIMGLVLAGKIGSAVAAEIGSMKISEQIDALKTLAINPVGFLGWPKIAAAIIMVPIITIFSDVCATLVFYGTSMTLIPWVSSPEFVAGLKLNFSIKFLVRHMIVKPALYGFIISFFAFYFGMRTQKGARGIGLSSHAAMLASSMTIIALNGIM